MVVPVMRGWTATGSTLSPAVMVAVMVGAARVVGRAAAKEAVAAVEVPSLERRL